MKTVLLLDPSIATLNMGDEIINCSIKQNMDFLLKDNYYINLPTHTPSYYRYQNILYPKKLGIYQNADYKLLCGTNILYTNMLRPLPNWNIHLFNIEMIKNTILLGVGIGVNSQNMNTYTKVLYSKILSRNYIHSTRDEVTKTILGKIGFQAINTGCPTLWKLTPQFCSQIPSEKADTVVFTLTYYCKDYSADKEMIELLKRSYKNVFFWPQCLLDLDYLKELGGYGECTIVAPNLRSFDELLQTDIDYVGTRLHGGIFALQHKKRAIIVSIDYRANEMKKNYSIPCIEREELHGELEKKIFSSWNTDVSGLNFDDIEQWKKQFKQDE